MQVTPRRLRVALLSLTPRNQQVLEYYFRTTGYGRFALVDETSAEAAIFDYDNPASRMHWLQFADSGRPGIALSITPEAPPGAYRINKPVTPEALCEAAIAVLGGHTKAARSSAATMVEPIPEGVAQEAAAGEGIAAPDVGQAAVGEPSGGQAAVEPGASEQGATQRSAAEPDVEGAPAPASILVGAASDDDDHAGSEPALTDDTRSEPAPAEAPVAAKRSAGVLGWLGHQWRRLLSVRAARESTPPVLSPPVPAPFDPAPPEALPEAPKAAAAMRSATPTPAHDARMQDEQLAEGDSAAALARDIAASEGAQQVEVEAEVDAPSGPAKSVAGSADAPTPQSARVPEVSIRDERGTRGKPARKPVGGPAGKTSRTRRPATPAASPAAATVVQATPEIIAEQPAEALLAVMPEALPVAAPATSIDARIEVKAVAQAEARIEAQREPGTPQPAVPATAAVTVADTAAGSTPLVASEIAPEHAPEPRLQLREVSTGHESEEQAKYCGTRGDLGAVELLTAAGAFYQFEDTLLAVLKEVYLVGTKWEVPTHAACGPGGVTFIPSENRAYLSGFGEQELAELCGQPKPSRIKVKMLSVQEFSAMQDELARGARVDRFDALVWRLGLLTARGRLPRGTPLDQAVYLRCWPNLTRLHLTPNAPRIAALWATRGAAPLETAKLLGIPQRHVFAFYNAALALELLTTDGSHVRARRRFQGRSGLLGKLLRWLQR